MQGSAFIDRRILPHAGHRVTPADLRTSWHWCSRQSLQSGSVLIVLTKSQEDPAFGCIYSPSCVAGAFLKARPSGALQGRQGGSLLEIIIFERGFGYSPGSPGSYTGLISRLTWNGKVDNRLSLLITSQGWFVQKLNKSSIRRGKSAYMHFLSLKKKLNTKIKRLIDKTSIKLRAHAADLSALHRNLSLLEFWSYK